MKKKILPLVLLVVIVLVGASIFLINFITREKTLRNDENQTLIEEVKNSESESVLENEQKPVEEVDKKTNNNELPKVDEKTESKKETKIINNKETKKVEESIKEVLEQNSDTKVNEVVKLEPWEELGISEDDYYNKPMWSWARIDFSINDYGSQELTEQACRNKGQEYFEQGYGFSCSGVNSYSGKYLGEMLKTF